MVVDLWVSDRGGGGRGRFVAGGLLDDGRHGNRVAVFSIRLSRGRPEGTRGYDWQAEERLRREGARREKEEGGDSSVTVVSWGAAVD